MNEPLLHIPNISINYCLKAINTRSFYKAMHTIQMMCKQKHKIDLDRDRNSLTEPN